MPSGSPLCALKSTPPTRAPWQATACHRPVTGEFPARMTRTDAVGHASFRVRGKTLPVAPVFCLNTSSFVVWRQKPCFDGRVCHKIKAEAPAASQQQGPRFGALRQDCQGWLTRFTREARCLRFGLLVNLAGPAWASARPGLRDDTKTKNRQERPCSNRKP